MVDRIVDSGPEPTSAAPKEWPPWDTKTWIGFVALCLVLLPLAPLLIIAALVDWRAKLAHNAKVSEWWAGVGEVKE